MDLRLEKALARIKNSSDGVELLEALDVMREDNYRNLLYCDPSIREVYAGRAQMIKEIKDLIINAENKCIERTKDNPAEWSL